MQLIRKISTVAALACASAALVCASNQYLRVDVPFSFVFGGQQFPAGAYDIQEGENGLITIQNGQIGAAVLSSPGRTNESIGARLQFETVNGHKYLSGLKLEGMTRSITVHPE